MPQIVTHIRVSRRAAASVATRRMHLDDRVRVADAYCRRLAALRTHAPDTLRARVRRELRAAAESITIPE
jgi:hypothetical protein